MSAPDPITQLNAALSGRYDIECVLGRGGMATVYLARDRKHRRNVALKVLKPELAAVVGADRFLAEIETTASLQHPHILPLFDSGEADGFLFYVMPHVEGESLRDRLDRERQLPVDEAVAIAGNVAEALHYAHQRGVIHRDIKPANILLQAGKPVVSDFGIALALGAASEGRLTETGLSLGTPHYMSPEQAGGDAHVDARSDVYALGCVLYEALTGDPPYHGSSPQVVLAKILTDPAPAPTKSRPSTPRNVDGAVLKAMERFPADRFESADVFARALADPRFRYEDASARAAARSTPWLKVSAGLAVMSVLLGTLWARAFLREPPSPLGPAAFTLALPDALGPVGDPAAVNVTVSPDGSAVVFAGASRDGGVQLWQRRLNELEPTPIPGTENAQNPRFSPDGESLAFTANLGVRTMSLSGAPPRTVIAAADPSFRGLAWASDGMIYIGQVNRGIARVAQDGGVLEEVVAARPGEFLRWPDVLPDARGVLFTRWSDGLAEIGVLSLEDGTTRSLLEGDMARYAPSGHIVYVSRAGTLLAVPFDVDRLEVSGSPQALAEGVTVWPSSAAEFAISQNGLLVYKRGLPVRGGTPVWVEAGGRHELLDAALEGQFRRPAISPDGRRVALEHVPSGSLDWGVWIYDYDQSGAFYRLAFEGPNFDPFWSPDGREVGFSSAHAGPPALYARPRDASEPARQLRVARGRPLFEGHWTPDGRWIVYRVGTNNEGTDIAYGPPHPDSASISIADSRFDELLPRLSPDGHWLAYQSNESGRNEIYVTPFPGPGGRTPVSADGGEFPVWSDSGQEILYMGANGFWITASVRADPGFTVQSRRPFASAEGFVAERGFALSPDGRRILAIRSDSAAERIDIVVVQAFLEEVGRLLPPG